MTGSGLPVSLIQSPSQNFNFLTCVTGQRVDLLCALQNRCTQLPVNFRFRKLPHFSTNPSIGTISPGQCQVTMACCDKEIFCKEWGNVFFLHFPEYNSVLQSEATRDLPYASKGRCPWSCQSAERSEHQ